MPAALANSVEIARRCAVTLRLGNPQLPIYRIVYVVTVLLGAGVNLGLVWAAADVFNGLMAVPNLIALLLQNKLKKMPLRLNLTLRLPKLQLAIKTRNCQLVYC